MHLVYGKLSNLWVRAPQPHFALDTSRYYEVLERNWRLGFKSALFFCALPCTVRFVLVLLQ